MEKNYAQLNQECLQGNTDSCRRICGIFFEGLLPGNYLNQATLEDNSGKLIALRQLYVQQKYILISGVDYRFETI